MNTDNSKALPCPFCGQQPNIDDGDTLYPSGTGWLQRSNGLRSYHCFTEVPKEQWCYRMYCNECYGGCGAEMQGDSKVEALSKWNRRVASTTQATKANINYDLPRLPLGQLCVLKGFKFRMHSDDGLQAHAREAIASDRAKRGEWIDACEWLRDNYQNHPNIASLLDAMLAATPHAKVKE